LTGGRINGINRIITTCPTFPVRRRRRVKCEWLNVVFGIPVVDAKTTGAAGGDGTVGGIGSRRCYW
jgi:hypothetical protein